MEEKSFEVSIFQMTFSVAIKDFACYGTVL